MPFPISTFGKVIQTYAMLSRIRLVGFSFKKMLLVTLLRQLPSQGAWSIQAAPSGVASGNGGMVVTGCFSPCEVTNWNISNLHKPSRFEEVEVGEVDFLRYLLPNFIAMIGSRIFGRNGHHSQPLTSQGGLGSRWLDSV
jgi:hypothetical protein